GGRAGGAGRAAADRWSAARGGRAPPRGGGSGLGGAEDAGVVLAGADGGDRPGLGLARAVPAGVHVGQAQRAAVGAEGPRGRPADPGEHQAVLALEEAVAAHAAGGPALG